MTGTRNSLFTEHSVGEPSEVESLSTWLELAAKMINAGNDLASMAQAELGNGPQVVGLALLARSINHMQCVPDLITTEHIVEARILTRSLFENLFVAVALREDGPATLRELRADHHASRNRRGKLLAGNLTAFSTEQVAQVRVHLEKIDKGRMMTPSDLAKRTSFETP